MKYGKFIKGALAAVIGLFVSASYANPLYTEDFESYELNTPITSLPNWSAGEGDRSIVTTYPAMNDTKLLKVDSLDESVLTTAFDAAEFASESVYIDADILLVPRVELSGFDMNSDQNKDFKLGFYSYKPDGATEAKLVVYHSYVEADGTWKWINDITDVTIPEDKAVSVKITMKSYSGGTYTNARYAPVAFTIEINGTAVTSPYAYDEAAFSNDYAGLNQDGGTMFIVANIQYQDQVSSISKLNISGPGYLDNIVVDRPAPPMAKIAITQSIPETAYTGADTPVSFTLSNSGNAAFAGNAMIRFQGSNKDQAMTLTFADGVQATECKPEQDFLGYDVPVTVSAGKSVTIDATAKTTVPRAYSFKTLTETECSSTATLTVTEPPVAEVGGRPCATFVEALASVQDGETIKLLADVADVAPFRIDGKSITLDLNGKKLSGQSVDNQFTDIVPSGQEYNLIAIAADAGLTVKDSAGNGVLEIRPTLNDDNSHIGVRGTFTLESGTVQAFGGGWYGNLVHAIGGTVNINGGTLEMVGNGDGRADKTLYSDSDATVSITGGTILNSDTGHAVEADGPITLSDCQIRNSGDGHALYLSGQATLDRVNIKSESSDSMIYGGKNSDITINSGTYDNHLATGSMLDGQIAITGGTFTGGDSLIFDSSKIVVQDGRFDSLVPVGNCAPGLVPDETPVDGYYTVREMTDEDVRVTLTYTENGEAKTQKFIDITKALDTADDLPETITDDLVTVIKDYNDPAVSVSAYNARQLLIPQGVTLTCSSITVSAGSYPQRVALLNQGTIHANSIWGSYGHITMENQGEIFCNYMSAETDGWKNSGTIHLGVKEAKASTFQNFINTETGVIDAKIAGTKMTVLGDPFSMGNQQYIATYAWQNGAWVPSGKVMVLQGDTALAAFDDFDEACDYAATAGADTLKLLADIDGDALTINDGVVMTLDLNGHFIKYGNSMDSGVLTVNNNGALTVIDSSEAKNGYIHASYDVSAVYVKSDARFTLESGKLIGNDTRPTISIANRDVSHLAAEAGAPGAVVNINGGTVWNEEANAYAILILGTDSNKKNYQSDDPILNVNGGLVYSKSGIAITGQGSFNNTQINITGGTVKSEVGLAMYHPQYGRLNISGGTVIGETGISFKGGDAVISGNAVIRGTGARDYPTSGAGGGSYQTGDAFYVEDNYNRAPTVTVTGGTFESDHAAGINKLFGPTKPEVAPGKIEVSGGTFSSDPSEYVVPGYEAAADADGAFDVAMIVVVTVDYTEGGVSKTENFQTLSAAMERAGQLTGAIVTVVKDVAEPDGFFYAYNANKVVINEGVTVICDIIKMGGSDQINRVILENHGTLNVNALPYSSGTGLLVNTGTLNVGYIRTSIEGWTNSGTINLRWNGETWPSELGSLENTGTVKADHEGYEATFAGTGLVGSYKWSGSAWIADGAFLVKKAGAELASFKEFDSAMDYAAANAGDTIALTQDVELVPTTIIELGVTPAMTIDHDITLDLGGHAIRWAASEQGKSFHDAHMLFAVTDGAQVTVTGEGTVDSRLGENTSSAFWLNSGTAVLTIENGVFTGSPSAVQVTEGTLNVNGGDFRLAEGVPADQAKYVVNCIDANFKTGDARISIKGGNFCFDPSANPEGAGTTYVADGYKAVPAETGIWKVVEDPVVTVTYTENGEAKTENFGGLSEAMNRVGMLTATDAVVTVLKDVNEPGAYFYAYDANKVVINEGVTVTCDIIKMGGSDQINRVILENHGTLNVNALPYSYGTGLLVNTGTLNVGYIRTSIEGWTTSGTINLGWNGETWPSELGSLENTGTVKADHEGYEATFAGTGLVGSYKWSGSEWVANGVFDVMKGAVTTASFKEFDSAMEYAAANAGDTIALTEDIELVPRTIIQLGITTAMTIDHDITLDLGGHAIRWAASEQSKDFNDAQVFFAVENGAKVTVTGAGSVDATLGQNTSYAFWVNSEAAVLTIENGLFTGSPSAVQVTEGTLNVNGGDFRLAAGVPAENAKYVVNCIDANFKTGAANVDLKGGTYCFDPSANPEGAGTTYVADGYKAEVSADGFYTIVWDSYAENDEIAEGETSVTLTKEQAVWLNGILEESDKGKAEMDAILKKGDGDLLGLEAEYLLNSNPTVATEVSFKIDSIVIGTDAQIHVNLVRTEGGKPLPSALNGAISILASDTVDGVYEKIGTLEKGLADGEKADTIGSRKFFKAELVPAEEAPVEPAQ